MIPRSRPPPKFEDEKEWSYVTECFLYYDQTKNKIIVMENSMPDDEDVFWIGYARSYIHRSNLALGQDIDLYRAGSRVREWGLHNKEKEFELFSILHKKTWHTFCTSEYSYGFYVECAPERVWVQVYRKSDKEVVLETDIYREKC